MFQNTDEHISSSILLEEKGGLGIQRFIFLFSFFLVGSFVLWAIHTELDEVAVGNGMLVPKDSIQVVQHVYGGKIKKVFIKDGAHVKSGQNLFAFDPKEANDSLKRIKSQIKSELVKYRSLAAELKEKKKLARQGVFPRMQLKSLLRTLKESEGKITDFKIRRNILRKNLQDLTLKAPISGVVFNLKAKKSSYVSKPGEVLLEIVPDGNKLIAEINIKPADIGHIRTKQAVMLKFSTYDFNRYGGLKGMIASISPSTIIAGDNQPVYKAIVLIERTSLTNDASKTPLIPGMTLTADIRVGSKSIMEYLLKPIFSSAQSAFRER
ncbi:MAG: HlyD family efflux transporter periplasmic adaptor subunit [Oligoflexales bacterium]